MSTAEELHRAVARYEVYISRWIGRGRKRESVSTGHTWPQAVALSEQISERLAREEPQWVGCMCRSTGGIQLTNTEQVAQILGYGPGFSHERATQTVLDLAARGALPPVNPDGGGVDAGLPAAPTTACSELAPNRKAVEERAHAS